VSRAALIVIGNEVLSGRTQDLNVQFLGSRLNDLGVRLAEVRIVADVTDSIVSAINACRGEYDYVFTTGGIGPTHDDITSAAVAKAFAVPLVRHPDALAALQLHYRGRDLNPERLKMADVPEGAVLIDNPISKAPGFRIDNVFVLPGVPKILQAMFEGIKDRLTGGAPMLSRTVVAFVGEGDLAGGLGRVQGDHPGLEIGSYPFVRDGRLGACLVVRGTDAAELGLGVDRVKLLVRSLGADPIEE